MFLHIDKLSRKQRWDIDYLFLHIDSYIIIHISLDCNGKPTITVLQIYALLFRMLIRLLYFINNCTILQLKIQSYYYILHEGCPNCFCIEHLFQTDFFLKAAQTAIALKAMMVMFNIISYILYFHNQVPHVYRIEYLKLNLHILSTVNIFGSIQMRQQFC